LKLLRVVVATRLPPGSCPLCRPGDRRCVGQVTDVCGVVRHAGRSRSIPVGYPGRRLIEHDCNPAARQAVYPVGEEHDPDPSAPQQGAGRDLTCQPYPARPRRPAGLTGQALVLWRATGPASALADSAPMPLPGACYPSEATLSRRGACAGRGSGNSSRPRRPPDQVLEPGAGCSWWRC